jgi:formylglycine-generating enzyme required for sulfatase activity
VQGELLEDMGAPRVHLRARVAAGEALGRLGDPRFEAIEVDGRRVLLPPLVQAPAGRYALGSSAWEVWRLGRTGLPATDERPQHAVQLGPLAIGRYPVTRAEFAGFVEGGGYHERWFDTEAGRAWLRGEYQGGAQTELLDVWRNLKQNPSGLEQAAREGRSPQAIRYWERAIALDEETFRESLRKRIAERPRDRPAFWDDARFNNPSQPVVGVSWFEARAYCRWLEDRWQRANAPAPFAGRFAVRLPTEAEWEAAARGGGKGRYPWGRRWRSDRANTVEAHLLRTTSVGVFPRGATRSGVSDMSGNVWEWTASLFRPYPYAERDGPNDATVEGPRVVRGGSWYDLQRIARCAYRSRSDPGNFGDLLGFRVVLSLANSEF